MGSSLSGGEGAGGGGVGSCTWARPREGGVVGWRTPLLSLLRPALGPYMALLSLAFGGGPRNGRCGANRTPIHPKFSWSDPRTCTTPSVCLTWELPRVLVGEVSPGEQPIDAERGRLHHPSPPPSPPSLATACREPGRSAWCQWDWGAWVAAAWGRAPRARESVLVSVLGRYTKISSHTLLKEGGPHLQWRYTHTPRTRGALPHQSASGIQMQPALDSLLAYVQLAEAGQVACPSTAPPSLILLIPFPPSPCPCTQGGPSQAWSQVTG